MHWSALARRSTGVWPWTFLSLFCILNFCICMFTFAFLCTGEEHCTGMWPWIFFLFIVFCIFVFVFLLLNFCICMFTFALLCTGKEEQCSGVWPWTFGSGRALPCQHSSARASSLRQPLSFFLILLFFIIFWRAPACRHFFRRAALLSNKGEQRSFCISYVVHTICKSLIDKFGNWYQC